MSYLPRKNQTSFTEIMTKKVFKSFQPIKVGKNCFCCRCQIPHYDLDHYSPPGSVFINTTNGELNYNVTECTIEFNGTTTKCNSWVYDQGLFKSTIISKVKFYYVQE